MGKVAYQCDKVEREDERKQRPGFSIPEFFLTATVFSFFFFFWGEGGGLVGFWFHDRWVHSIAGIDIL